MSYLLHVRHQTGCVQTMAFPTPFARGLAMITLSAQAVELWTEDRE